MSLESMKKRIEYYGGKDADARLVKAKYNSFKSALNNSYQAEWVEFRDEKYRCLINSNKLNLDYDEKEISIDYNSNIQVGDVIYWNRTNTHWIIYLQKIEEEAYFRGLMRQCDTFIEINGYDYWLYLRGPVEKTIDWSNAHDISFNNLNYTNNEEKIIKSLLSEKSGMILVTGPTGCGKTTTMYTFLNELNKQESNIVTIEDPVEYTIDGINQIQVNQQAGLTFAGALRSILRQDPNVIMIGEIRDEETAQIAMRAALSGHLVISTLHTTSSIGAITRLLDMGIPKYLVSSALKVVICQRLVEVLCPKCKEEMKVSHDLRQKLEVDDDVKLYKKRGCQYCFNTGYKGRLLLSEVLEVDDKIKEMILSEASEKKIEQYAKKNKMILLSEKHKKVVIDGITTIEEI